MNFGEKNNIKLHQCLIILFDLIVDDITKVFFYIPFWEGRWGFGVLPRQKIEKKSKNDQKK